MNKRIPYLLKSFVGCFACFLVSGCITHVDICKSTTAMDGKCSETGAYTEFCPAEHAQDTFKQDHQRYAIYSSSEAYHHSKSK